MTKTRAKHLRDQGILRAQSLLKFPNSPLSSSKLLRTPFKSPRAEDKNGEHKERKNPSTLAEPTNAPTT
ncbi:uncharacterized protein G2W53_035003 [Senna tora]|uniref:Uncharacterized protein n=1 Tax=Senna tora TaxID=362788 RepID=A0A834SSQ8_9FABA|nr:uncharacterized protein G2W53_035003 [Senna tora]